MVNDQYCLELLLHSFKICVQVTNWVVTCDTSAFLCHDYTEATLTFWRVLVGFICRRPSAEAREGTKILRSPRSLVQAVAGA